MINEIARVLESCPLFKGLNEEQTKQISLLAEMVTVRKGRMIFSEGEFAEAFYVVADGGITIFKLSASGREQILKSCGPGSSFAEAALFADGKYPAYARAQEDSRVIRLKRDAFFNLINSNPQIALNMIAMMSERLRGFTRKIEQLSLMGVVPRLADYIARNSDGKAEFVLDISKGELASLLGTVPETLSRAFAKLKSSGYISEVGSAIHINDREALTQIAANHE